MPTLASDPQSTVELFRPAQHACSLVRQFLELAMANAKDRQVVEQVVQSRVAAGAMFTAYDITVQARAQGARIRHGEARDIVHNMFNNGTMGASYQRSVVDIGIATNPFVYHRYTDEPRPVSVNRRRRDRSEPTKNQPTQTRHRTPCFKNDLGRSRRSGRCQRNRSIATDQFATKQSAATTGARQIGLGRIGLSANHSQ